MEKRTSLEAVPQYFYTPFRNAGSTVEGVFEKSISQKTEGGWDRSVVGLISRGQLHRRKPGVGRDGFPASPPTTSVPISPTFVSILDGETALKIRIFD